MASRPPLRPAFEPDVYEIARPVPRFVYPRASPSVRWPQQEQHLKKKMTVNGDEQGEEGAKGLGNFVMLDQEMADRMARRYGDRSRPLEHVMEPEVIRKLNRKLVLLFKAKDWEERGNKLATAICSLEEHEFVSDLIKDWKEQLAPKDLCYVVRRVAAVSWQRALELYEFLNVKHWYCPDLMMLAAVLSALGKANQPEIAEDLFVRAEGEIRQNIQVFNAMMGVYAQSGNWSKVQKLLSKMQQVGCLPDIITFNTVIRARTKRGMHDGLASKLLANVLNAGFMPDVITYNTLISACSVNNRLSDAILIFEEMIRQKCRPDLWTFNSMISVYARAGRVKAARMIFKEMQEAGLEPDAVSFNSILYAFAKSCDFKKAQKVLRRMQEAGYRLDEITYNTTIHMYGKAEKPEHAKELYAEMKKDGCFPNVITYNILINVLGRAGLVSEAAGVFEDMIKSGVRPTVRSFSVMISAYSKAGMYKEAERAFSSMLSARICPDVVAYTQMLKVFHRAGLPEKCITLYKSMLEAEMKPDIGVHNIMIRTYYKERSIDEVEQLSMDLIRLGVNEAQLAHALARGGFFVEAGIILKLALAEGIVIKLETLDLVLRGLESSGDYVNARALVHSVPVLGSNVAAIMYRRLALMYAKGEKLAEAEEELRACLFYGQTQVFDIYKMLVTSYEQAGKHDEALALFQEMTCLGVQVDTDIIRSAALCYCRKGHPEVAHELLGDCLHTFGSLKNSTLHVAIMEAYGKLERWESAGIVFKDLQRRRLAADTDAFKTLLSQYSEIGRYNEATRLLEHMVSAGLQPTASCANYAFEAFARAGKSFEVAELYNRLPQLGIIPNMITFRLIFEAFAKTESVELAKNVYCEMRKSGYFPTLQLYKFILSIYCSAGSTSEAEWLTKDIEKDGFQLDGDMFGMMVEIYSRANLPKRARTVFKAMQEAGFLPDASTYKALIMVYGRNSMAREAETFLTEMKAAGFVPDFPTYSTVLGVYEGCDESFVGGAEQVFKSMLEDGHKPDAGLYELMINIHMKARMQDKVDELVTQMEEDSLEPSESMHLMLMEFYGKAGAMVKVQKAFESLSGAANEMHYISIVNGYLENKDYVSAALYLRKMKENEVQLRTASIVQVIRAASLCEDTLHALLLLEALAEAGFSLPIRLMASCSHNVAEDAHTVFQKLQESDPDGCRDIVNALVDLLWAFRQHATATLIFGMASELQVYGHVIARVQNRHWRADFLGLSPGAALVALTLWLDQMQEASLNGFPKWSPVVRILVGSAACGDVAVKNTIKMHLWQMGSPFLISDGSQAQLQAQGISVARWLRDSPHCLDLRLRNSPSLPKTNGVRLYKDAFVSAEMAAAIEEVEERMRETGPPKFCRYAHLEPATRAGSMQAGSNLKESLEVKAAEMAKELNVHLSISTVEQRKKLKKLEEAKGGRVHPPMQLWGLSEEEEMRKRLELSREKQRVRHGLWAEPPSGPWNERRR